MTFVKETWQADVCGPLSERNVRSLLAKADRYRVSRCIYDNLDWCRELTRTGQLYVISGSIIVRSKASEVTLGPGDAVHFPDGEYKIRVVSEAVADVIYVWDVGQFFSPDTSRH